MIPLRSLLLADSLCFLLLITPPLWDSNGAPESRAQLAEANGDSGAEPQQSARQSVQQDPAKLELGSPVERTLQAGVTDSFQVEVGAGQFLHAVVQQIGIDVVVSIIGPRGERLAEVDSPNEANGPEPISFLSELAGVYQLQVRAPGGPPGRYRIEIKELHAAAARDRDRVKAQQDFAEARRLRARSTAESFRMAIKKFEEALALYQSLGDLDREAHTLNLIGLTYAILGEPRIALGYYRQALARVRDNGDRTMQALILNNIGGAHDELGDVNKALEYYKEALDIRRETGHLLGQAVTLNNLGVVYVHRSEYQKALAAFNDALSLIRIARNETREAQTLNNLAGVYTVLGDLQNAQNLSLKSLEIFRKLRDRRLEAFTLDSLGAVSVEMEDHTRALKFYSEALSLRQQTGDRWGQAVTLNNTGWAHFKFGNAQRALEFFDRAIELRRVVGDRFGEALTLLDLGHAYGALGDHQKAITHYERALDMYRTLGDRRGEAACLNGLARAQRDSGKLAEACSHVDQAIAILEDLRISVRSAENRAGFVASNRGVYELQINLLMRLHDKDPGHGFDALALQASERARSRNLVEALNEAGVDIRQGVDPHLLDNERTVLQRLNAKELYRIGLVGKRAPQDQITDIEREIGELSVMYREIQGEIRAKSPRSAAVIDRPPLTVKEIQRDLLNRDTLLLEFALGDESSFLWLVSASSVESHRLPKRSEIESLARTVYESVTARNVRIKFETEAEKRARVAAAEEEFATSGTALSQVLFGQVSSKIGKMRLLIVAEGALQYIPFGALPVPRPDVVTGETGPTSAGRALPFSQPLLADHEIVTLPSASVLAVLRKEFLDRKPAPKTIAILADPVFEAEDPRVKRAGPTGSAAKTVGARGVETEVGESDDTSGLGAGTGIQRLPFTRQEAETIASLVPRDRRLEALDFAANRALALSTEMSNYRIVHFATHGVLNSKEPGLSAILLSMVDERGQPRDGRLHLNEVYNMNLRADLAVLSGCRTGLGKDIKGEGLIGLTRGFMYAGAPRVVVSLWEINDEATAELMRRFYLAMLGREGLRPAAALRAAQLQMLRDKRWTSPYYWAAFLIQGEWR
jgi:tetratricopeptide (TPR) repeat protein